MVAGGLYADAEFVENVQMLVHMHFEPNRINAAKARCEAKIAANKKPDRNKDYQARIDEYDARLVEITEIWTAAADDVRAVAHEQIDRYDASGLLIRGNV